MCAPAFVIAPVLIAKWKTWDPVQRAAAVFVLPLVLLAAAVAYKPALLDSSVLECGQTKSLAVGVGVMWLATVKTVCEGQTNEIPEKKFA